MPGKALLEELAPQKSFSNAFAQAWDFRGVGYLFRRGGLSSPGAFSGIPERERFYALRSPSERADPTTRGANTLPRSRTLLWMALNQPARIPPSA